MPESASQSLRASMEQALEDLRAQREQLNTELQQLDASESALLQAIEATAGIELPARRRPNHGAQDLTLKPSRLATVREYMAKHKTAVQSEIVKATGENSGTISIALRILERDGVVERGAVKNRSREWHWIGSLKDREEVRLKAGYGAVDGR